eukprot:5732534-Prymnesium_polylepis.1
MTVRRRRVDFSRQPAVSRRGVGGGSGVGGVAAGRCGNDCTPPPRCGSQQSAGREPPTAGLP